jgi:hypothetical protein
LHDGLSARELYVGAKSFGEREVRAADQQESQLRLTPAPCRIVRTGIQSHRSHRYLATARGHCSRGIGSRLQTALAGNSRPLGRCLLGKIMRAGVEERGKDILC